MLAPTAALSAWEVLRVWFLAFWMSRVLGFGAVFPIGADFRRRSWLFRTSTPPMVQDRIPAQSSPPSCVGRRVGRVIVKGLVPCSLGSAYNRPYGLGWVPSRFPFVQVSVSHVDCVVMVQIEMALLLLGALS